MTNNQTIIEAAFEERSKITPDNVSADIKDAINQTIDGLNDGSLRVASRIKDSQNWETHQWIKKAVLLSFRTKENEVMDGSYTKFFDKVDSKFNGFSEKDFKNGFRQDYLYVESGATKAKSATFLAQSTTNDVYSLSGESGDPFIITEHPRLGSLQIEITRNSKIN